MPNCTVPSQLRRYNTWNYCKEWARWVDPKGFRSSFGCVCVGGWVELASGTGTAVSVRKRRPWVLAKCTGQRNTL
jgi:hypothetical protein